ncbi:MAG: serine hydrolase domain-containing protein [Planctomycetota bacterium]|nr:serine hydrolase domain-containing protein [Planctomycetota bacterium]
MKYLVALLAACVVLVSEAFPQETAASKEELRTKLDRAVQTPTSGGFWGAVLVARKGETLLARGYGNADYAARPNTEKTLFEIASTSKMFTAAGILKLEMQGKLNTEDPVSKFFKNVPDDKKKVTVFHLLTHTAGIDDERAIVPYASPMTRDEFIKHAMAAPLKSEPGSTFSYSNAGYALLAAIIEIASGESFESYMKKNIFKPAKMTDTGFVKDPDLDPKRDSARLNGDSCASSSLDWFWGWGYRGMGGVVTTVLDLLEWHRALNGDKVLNTKTKEKFFAPYRSNYACGCMVERTVGRGTKVSHTGSVAGFRSLFARHVEQDIVIAILTNENSDMFEIEKRISDILLPPERELEVALDIHSFEAAGPVFEIEHGTEWRVEKAESKIRLAIVDPAKKSTIVSILMAHAAAKTFLANLDNILEQRPSKDPAGGEKADMKTGLYLQPYGLSEKRVSLSEGVFIRLNDSYSGQGEDGKTVTDPRITFVLDDRLNHQWPVMVLMNPAAAKSLAVSLRDALTK